jgi:uncharacterized YigZ family protein
MEDGDRYRIVTGPGEGSFRDRASKFIGLAYPTRSLPEVKELIAALRKAHPGAVHFCHASVLGADGAEQRSNDDGEPSGTAGRPILRQIIAAGVTDTAVIVVRYFGGTLLGKGGLVQAYGEAARLALAAAPQEDRWRTGTVAVTCPHARFEQVRLDIERSGGRITHAEFLATCSVRAEVPRSRIAALLERWVQQGLLDARRIDGSR